MNSPIDPYGSQSVFTEAVGWINDLLLGSLAVGLCSIAVALVGLMMLGGQLPVRQGMRVILGCFILLGAPVIAAGLTGIWQQDAPAVPEPLPIDTQPREELPPADYDPYAGASLRRD